MINEFSGRLISTTGRIGFQRAIGTLPRLTPENYDIHNPGLPKSDIPPQRVNCDSYVAYGVYIHGNATVLFWNPVNGVRFENYAPEWENLFLRFAYLEIAWYWYLNDSVV